MYRPEIEGKRIKDYHDRLKTKGLKDCHIWLTPQQWEVVKAIAQCIRKIKDLDDIVGLDVSPDNKEFKIITDKSARKMVLTNYDDTDDI